MKPFPDCRVRLLACWVILLALIQAQASCAERDLRGQASGWASVAGKDGKWNGGLGAHYLPQLTVGTRTGEGDLLDLEVSAEAFAWTDQGDLADTAAVDLYRLKLRYATPRTESRLGLQQINFGPAYLLRSLRWFDRLDVRDPLGTTEGVYALNFKYVTGNNTGLWLWALYGNDEPKGNEILPSLEHEPEVGGRLQIPIATGEGAVTVHYRKVDGPGPFVDDFDEYRFALDGRWDILIGAWFEAVLIRQQSKVLPYGWRKMITLGADYTFPAGNGLHALLEHMVTVSSEDASGWDVDSGISGLSLSYPLGYADRLSAIPLYYHEAGEVSLYAAWEHYWDSLMLVLSASRYPDIEEYNGMPDDSLPGAGYEGRLLIMFNH